MWFCSAMIQLYSWLVARDFVSPWYSWLVACDFVLAWYSLIADLLHMILFHHDIADLLHVILFQHDTTCYMWFCSAMIQLYSRLVACDFVLPWYNFIADCTVTCDFVLPWYDFIADLLHVILFCHHTTLQLTGCMWLCFAMLCQWLTGCSTSSYLPWSLPAEFFLLPWKSAACLASHSHQQILKRRETTW